ncbi:hypothetical protein AVEN_204586-1 [Araneus ventricosus]|uniref:Uncharacterized protein n=1 Tax=Araneus ventricosus TaxID=182803 RepID=A0A4Y2JU79_ARAVE|nr:hypothetical protein AVEN_204586-1 [Araneus ventricosus]
MLGYPNLLISDNLAHLRIKHKSSIPILILFGTAYKMNICMMMLSPPAGVVQKYPHWPGLPKKGVRPGEDQRGESRPTDMWRTGFIKYNKMIQGGASSGVVFVI